MEKIDDILFEIEAARGKGSSLIESLLEGILLGESLKKLEHKFHCQISLSKEKHNALQFTEYYTITSVLIDGEISLVIENGINNGTQLNDYSFSGNLIPKCRTVEVITDVVLDEQKYENQNQFSLIKALAVFPRYKQKLMESARQEGYDNYVTGGGTNKTISHYKSFHDELENMGLFYKYVYEEIEADINLI